MIKEKLLKGCRIEAERKQYPAGGYKPRQRFAYLKQKAGTNVAQYEIAESPQLLFL